MTRRHKRPKRRRILRNVLSIAIIAAVIAGSLYAAGVFEPEMLHPADIPHEDFSMYLDLANRTGGDWRFFACAAHLNGEIDDRALNYAENGKVHSTADETALAERINAFFQTDEDALKEYVKRLKIINDTVEHGGFPIRGEYGYSDSWGASRTYGGERTHEGTDIMCRTGTNICAAAAGKVVKIGWNELGGWRIGIRDGSGVYYYYAHLSAYATGMDRGVNVERGEIIGYVGDTGYGPQGTSGKFAPHLHFGMYYRERAFNPYPYLRYWETLAESLD